MACDGLQAGLNFAFFFLAFWRSAPCPPTPEIGTLVHLAARVDSGGRDMCDVAIQRDSDLQPAQSDFGSYDACMARRGELRAFDAMLGGAASGRVILAPWHVVPPSQSVPGTYFSRGRAETIDCYAQLRAEGPPNADGFIHYGVSVGGQHDLRGHQCVTVCTFQGAVPSSCDPGSVTWIAHDLVAQLRGM